MIFYFLSSILLIYLAFPNYFNPYGFWPLALIFAVPLFFVLEGRSLPQRVLLGTLFGLIFYALLVQWLIPYSLLGYILFVLVLTIQPVLFAALYRSSGRLVDILYIPALWVASEYLRTLLLGGFSWNLGHSQTFNIYGLQIANLFGSWGISFVLILINYCLYCLIRKFENRKIYAAVLVAVIVFVAGYGILSIPSASVTKSVDTFDVCAVQSNIDSRQKVNPDFIPHHVAHQIALSQSCLTKKKPDLIIWPETAIASDFIQDPGMKDQMLKFVRAAGVPVLVGAALWKGEGNQNSAVLLLPDGHIRAVYHKRYLVPFSEYMPSGGTWPAVSQLFHLKDFHFIPGRRSPLFSLANYKFGVAICSEDTIGFFFRQFSKYGAGFAVVLLNDGWFRHNAALVIHGQNAIMHAVENRLPIVRVANTGWTSFIDPYGRVKSNQEPWFNSKAVVTYKIHPHFEKTLFQRIGDIFAVFCCVFVIIFRMAQFATRPSSSMAIDDEGLP